MSTSPEHLLEQELKALSLRQPSDALDQRIKESLAVNTSSSAPRTADDDVLMDDPSLTPEITASLEAELRSLALNSPSESMDEKVAESLQPLPQEIQNLEAELFDIAQRHPSQMLDLRVDQAMKDGFEFSDDELNMVEALADLRLVQVPDSLDEKVSASLEAHGQTESLVSEIASLTLSAPGITLDDKITASFDAHDMMQESVIVEMTQELTQLKLNEPSPFLDQRIKASLQQSQAQQKQSSRWIAWAPAIAAMLIIGTLLLPVIMGPSLQVSPTTPGSGTDVMVGVIPGMPEDFIEFHTVNTEVIPDTLVETDEGAMRVWHIRHIETTTLEDLNDEVTITITENAEEWKLRDLELF